MLYKRRRWNRDLIEIDGILSAQYRRDNFRRLLDTYIEVDSWDIGCSVRPYSPISVSLVEQGINPSLNCRSRIMDLAFNPMGSHLVYVTVTGCISFVNFKIFSVPKYQSHICQASKFTAVRWNETNQLEVCCASGKQNKIFLYDIGASVFTKVLQRNEDSSLGYSDVAYALAEKSWVLGAAYDGRIDMWDSRCDKFPCASFISDCQKPLYSIDLDNTQNWILYGAGKNGKIYTWDRRGERRRPLESLDIRTLLKDISPFPLANIVSNQINSIRLNPSCTSQLAFHCQSGWTGVLNLISRSVTHMHRLPNSWTNSFQRTSYSYFLKPAWLPGSSAYAIGSPCVAGVYLLDFFDGKSSGCFIEPSDASTSHMSCRVPANHGGQHKFITTSDTVLTCAAHPRAYTILAGTMLVLGG